MSSKDFKKDVKKAIFFSDFIERLSKISYIISEISEGIDEISKDFRVRNKDRIKLKKNPKR